jgi:hypothetical protein
VDFTKEVAIVLDSVKSAVKSVVLYVVGRVQLEESHQILQGNNLLLTTVHTAPSIKSSNDFVQGLYRDCSERIATTWSSPKK